MRYGTRPYVIHVASNVASQSLWASSARCAGFASRLLQTQLYRGDLISFMGRHRLLRLVGGL